MASVYNSRNTVIDLDTDISFTGRWEDVQGYVSVINTLVTDTDTSGTVNFQWLNMDDDSVPADNATPLVSDTYRFGASQTLTKQFDTRARWFRLKVQGTGPYLNKISTNYKKAPTEIKLTDDSTHIVNVNLGDTYNALYTVLTDASGAIIGSTNDAHTGEALYVHLADSSGAGLATTNNNRDINRTLTDADLSFTFTNAGTSTDVCGSMITSMNRFRLNRAEIPFKDGDTVRFAVGALGQNDFSLNAAYSTPVNPRGILKATATVRYREVEADHVQFELLVNKNMSEWFNPAIGFSNFDVSHFTASAEMASVNRTRSVAVAPSGYAYLYESSVGYVPRVDDYYAAFANISGFNVSGAGLSLTPGPYPMDLRFYRGSLTSSMGLVNVASFDLSAAYNPAESLSVALRDSQNQNLASTGAGSTAYYIHHTRSAPNNILFLVDTCFTGSNPNVEEVVHGIRKVAETIATRTGVAPVTAVAGYAGAVRPVFTRGVGTPPGHMRGSVLKPLNATTQESDWNNGGDYEHVNADVQPKSNYWQALSDYVSLETPDTCMSTVFTSSLDTIVLFSFNDSSASEAHRTAYDACAGFFNGIDKIVVTGYNNDITELLTFAGTTDNFYRYSSTGASIFDTCFTLISTLANRIAGIRHEGHNALHIHTADVCGASQAGTRPITDAQFGEVALYYALADSCGTKLDTTKSTTATTGLNAMYVSLVTNVNAQGTPLANPSTVNSIRPLHITFDEQFVEGKMFDFTVSGHIVTVADLSNNNVNLKSLGIANETPAPIWLKIYDMSHGFFMNNSGAVLNTTTGLYDSSAAALQSRLVYNIAVPGLQSRDLDFSKGVKFDNGIYMVASTNYRYDSYAQPPGNQHIYVHGSYENIS